MVGIARDQSGRSLRLRHADTVVIGSGVAGMSTALALGRCVLVTGAELGDGGSSPLAQGGVAAAIGADDSTASHLSDTLAVAGGLADPEVASTVAAGGPAAIARLVALGAAFDRDDQGQIALGREAGHSARRIVHANGDATGAAVVDALREAVRAAPEVEVLERTEAVDLVTADGQVVGVLMAGPGGEPGETGDVDEAGELGELEVLLAGAVVLATGGYAHCFERTTTPPAVIGSGIAMAARAGAAVADMEMVQFHPTALDVPGAARLPLLTEALRGEGAILVNDLGDRYLAGEHPDAELAPRDVVARAGYRQILAGRRPYLDARQAVGDRFPERFPTVFRLARQHGFDPRSDLLPTTPAAHYCMGGVAVDHLGRASLRGLWAVGETASTGLHGANRLASNSLLEGLVLAGVIADDAATGPHRSVNAVSAGVVTLRIPADWRALAGGGVGTGALDGRRLPATANGRTANGRTDDGTGVGIGLGVGDQISEELRRVLWRGAGVQRDAAGLSNLLVELDRLAERAQHQLRSRTIHTVAKLVVKAAMARTESRGAHYRFDHPSPDPAQATRRPVPPRPVATDAWQVQTMPASLPSPSSLARRLACTR